MVIHHHHGIAAELGGFFPQFFFNLGNRRGGVDTGVDQYFAQSNVRAKGLGAQHHDFAGQRRCGMFHADVGGGLGIDCRATAECQQRGGEPARQQGQFETGGP
ncbi:hypothetical protein D3C76_948180 [compost metagenome]